MSRPTEAKRCVLIVAGFSLVVNATIHCIDVAQLAATDDGRLAKILYALKQGVKIGDELNTAYYLLTLRTISNLAFLVLALVVWLERCVLSGLLGAMLLLTVTQIALLQGKFGGNMIFMYMSIWCCIYCTVQLVMMTRIRRRTQELMYHDQARYDDWWHSFSSDASNNQALRDLQQKTSLVHQQIWDSATSDMDCVVGSRVRQLYLPLVVRHEYMAQEHQTLQLTWRPNSPPELTPVKCIDMLFQQAVCLRPALQRKLMELMADTPHASRVSAAMETPLKSHHRAVEKTLLCYGGDCSFLVDVCRDMMVFERVDDISEMLDRMRQDPQIKIVRIKNRLEPSYDSSLSAGYRDVMLNIKLDNSESRGLGIQNHVAEIQLIPSAVYAMRAEEAFDHSQHFGHANYVRWRNLRGH